MSYNDNEKYFHFPRERMLLGCRSSKTYILCRMRKINQTKEGNNKEKRISNILLIQLDKLSRIYVFIGNVHTYTHTYVKVCSYTIRLKILRDTCYQTTNC